MKDEDQFVVGFMDYPAQFHKPLPGTSAELHWARGWAQAQRDAIANRTNDELEQDSLFGRDTYAIEYRTGA